MMVVRVLLLAMWALGAQAAEKTSPVLIGHVYDPEAFKPTALPYRGDFDRLMTEYEALDGETFRVRREDFGGSAEAEWLIVSPERRCGAEGCAYTLIDDQHAREIGRFLGVLDCVETSAKRLCSCADLEPARRRFFQCADLRLLRTDLSGRG